MNKKQVPMGEQPNYKHGQLLDEDDFLDEQRFHINARRRHNQHCHGCGVVSGLDVVAKGGRSVTVNSGLAIDEEGRDIVLKDAETIDIADLKPDERAKIFLAYKDEQGEGQDTSEVKRIKCFAVLTVSAMAEDPSALVLATVQLDREGKVRVDYTGRQCAELPPGSVTADVLNSSLRTGWFRMPFRPVALVNIPEGAKEIPPAFRVGATEALSPSAEEAGEKDKGAAGTMAIPIPPSVKSITRFRVVGRRNEGEVVVQLLLGGWDPREKDHVRKILLKEGIKSSSPFEETFEIADTDLDAEYHTLSVWLMGTRRTSVSLVAVEFGY